MLLLKNDQELGKEYEGHRQALQSIQVKHTYLDKKKSRPRGRKLIKFQEERQSAVGKSQTIDQESSILNRKILSLAEVIKLGEKENKSLPSGAKKHD